MLCCTGDEFRSRLDTLMTQALHKGVPPLFNNLRSLYRDADKVPVQLACKLHTVCSCIEKPEPVNNKT